MELATRLSLHFPESRDHSRTVTEQSQKGCAIAQAANLLVARVTQNALVAFARLVRSRKQQELSIATVVALVPFESQLSGHTFAPSLSRFRTSPCSAIVAQDPRTTRSGIYLQSGQR